MTTRGVVTRTVRDIALYYAEAEKRLRNPASSRSGMSPRPSCVVCGSLP